MKRPIPINYLLFTSIFQLAVIVMLFISILLRPSDSYLAGTFAAKLFIYLFFPLFTFFGVIRKSSESIIFISLIGFVLIMASDIRLLFFIPLVQIFVARRPSVKNYFNSIT